MGIKLFVQKRLDGYSSAVRMVCEAGQTEDAEDKQKQAGTHSCAGQIRAALMAISAQAGVSHNNKDKKIRGRLDISVPHRYSRGTRFRVRPGVFRR
mgnify:CR=1 FL=1